MLTKHVHYTYDVFDHLISKSVDSTGSGSYDRAEYYVYDGANVVLDFVDPDGAGAQPVALATRYLNGPGNAGATDQVFAQEDVSTGNVLWLLADNLGTTRDVVDDTSAVVAHLVYNSFGQLASSATNATRFLYTGQVWDADAGLQYNWHRWYDPMVGRWISEDPAGFSAGDPNLGRYIANNVTATLDSTGLQPDLPNDEYPPLFPPIIPPESPFSGPPIPFNPADIDIDLSPPEVQPFDGTFTWTPPFMTGGGLFGSIAPDEPSLGVQWNPSWLDNTAVWAAIDLLNSDWTISFQTEVADDLTFNGMIDLNGDYQFGVEWAPPGIDLWAELTQDGLSAGFQFDLPELNMSIWASAGEDIWNVGASWNPPFLDNTTLYINVGPDGTEYGAGGSSGF